MMIESNTISEDAVQYLNDIQAKKTEQAKILGRTGARDGLLRWCNQWYDSARSWRKQSWEPDWLMWQRHADGRYDPKLAAKKKDWQSKLFVDLTPSHRENIHAELFRLIAGSRPLLDISARPGGDPEQAENIRDMELREMEKSRFEIEYNKIIEDKTTYGSAFMRMWYETRYEDRVTRVPITEQLNMMSLASIKRHMAGQPQIVGYQPTVQQKVIYRGVRVQHIPIWDFFIDPKALQIHGSVALFRSMMDLQHILDGVKTGSYMPESAMRMLGQASAEVTPMDRQLLQSERGISDVAPLREGNQAQWEGYELFTRLPQKWVYPLLQEPIDVTDADRLVPARVIFNNQTVFGVYLNDSYDGEPPFLKDDYFPVAGRFYGRGIPEMLKNPQAAVNAVVNQRLDEGDQALQSRTAVIEKAILNPEELESGAPGLVVRLDQKKLGPNGDVRNAIMDLERPDVKSNAGFVEVHEWERMASDRTSANRVVLGTPRVGDVGTKTLGGMQMLKSLAGEKFAFIAMLSEFSFLNEVFRTYWKLIYANIQPQDVVDALGQDRASRFQLMSPEEVELKYSYEPKGIFEREAKATLQARLSAIFEQFKGAPWIDTMAFFDYGCKSFNLDPKRLKIPEAEAMEIMGKAQAMAQPMAKQMLSDIVLGQAMKDVERNMAEKLAEHNAEQADENGDGGEVKPKKPEAPVRKGPMPMQPPPQMIPTIQPPQERPGSGMGSGNNAS